LIGSPLAAAFAAAAKSATVGRTIRPFESLILPRPARMSSAVASLFFGGMMPAGGSANIPDCLFSALRYALARGACGNTFMIGLHWGRFIVG
jgi:hypothetical protein